MSNTNTTKEALRTFYFTMRKKMIEPNNWIVLDRHNCLDFHCKGIIYIKDRELLKHYFPNAELCFSAWDNGLRLQNIIHIIGKSKRAKCKFCTKTFDIDDIDSFRVHILGQHISKDRYGRLTPQLSIRANRYNHNHNQTVITIEC